MSNEQFSNEQLDFEAPSNQDQQSLAHRKTPSYSDSELTFQSYMQQSEYRSEVSSANEECTLAPDSHAQFSNVNKVHRSDQRMTNIISKIKVKQNDINTTRNIYDFSCSSSQYQFIEK